MQQIENNISGYILAGGKSSRMGSDKGLMLLNKKAVIQHAIEQLEKSVKNIFIISNNIEYEKFRFEVIPDLIKDIGPAGGIYTALKHTHTNQNFIMSCDMPFVTTSAINFLLEKADSSQINLAIHKNKIEPLFGLYSKDCLAKWEKLILQNIIKLQTLVTHFNLQKIDFDQNDLFGDKLFLNLNTKKDFERALSQLM